MCPLCNHDAVLTGCNTAYLSTGPRHMKWLVCCHCGWESEVLENPSEKDLEDLAKFANN